MLDGEPRDEDELPAGASVGDYRVESVLGRGGFGSVYRAVHTVIGKQVAIKVLHRHFSVQAQMVSRFVVEARAVNQIGHRNIIDIFGFGQLDDGRHYYVMELLQGETLDERIYCAQPRAEPSVAETLAILRPLARALTAAHEHGIAHRDLKPENVFLVRAGDDGEGAAPLVKLLDFGIAKLGREPTKHSTDRNAPMGTPAYMSPEQVQCDAIDTRTDIYSLGVLAFEMLTSSLPFSGASVVDVMFKHTSAAPPLVSSRRPELAALDAPVAQMMEKDRALRPASAVEAVDALAEAAAAAGLDGGGASAATGALTNVRSASGARSRPGLPRASAAEAETQLAPPRRSGITPVHTAVLVAAAAAAVLVYATVVRQRPGVPPDAEAATAPSSPPAPPNVSPAPTATVSVSPAPESTAEVSVTFAIDPADAEVFVDGKRVNGTRLSLPRSESPVVVDVKKAGHGPASRPLTPDHDQTVAIKLRRIGPQGGKEYGSWAD